MKEQARLFGDGWDLQPPSTEGIKYAGSKLKLIPHILDLARKVNAKTVLDGFSGTTRVSQAFAQHGYDVVCNDRAAWSEVFGTCYLKGKVPREYQALIEHLNALPPKDGWFTEFYGGDTNAAGLPKRPWQIHNTRKLDAIREEIERLSLDPVDKCVALTSLILALDQVDSTLGHFVSYLREWSPRSYKSLQLKVPAIVGEKRPNAHRVHRADIFELIDGVETDIAYHDPPYGSNNEKMPPSRVRYASYYHLWTTICLYDQPALFGRANRRADSSDTVASSPFEDFRRGADGKFVAVEAIRRLLASTRSKHIILSYSSGGRATSEELNEAIESCGRLLEVVEIAYKRNVMAGMKWTNEWLKDADEPNREFLFLIARL
ncbi:DNA adenine methylase [Candidatus Binatus sp.]|uniref:DNA adenine methylase n=1 Tax=Candidatus Binatus sp. TaxID=2811406 RepID=UPI003CC61E17